VASKFTGPSGLPYLVESYHKRRPKTKRIVKLKEILQLMWDILPQGPINKALKEFEKRLKACVASGDGHLEQSQ